MAFLHPNIWKIKSNFLHQLNQTLKFYFLDGNQTLINYYMKVFDFRVLVYFFFTPNIIKITHFYFQTSPTNYWASLNIFSYYHASPQLFFLPLQNWVTNIKRYETQ